MGLFLILIAPIPVELSAVFFLDETIEGETAMTVVQQLLRVAGMVAIPGSMCDEYAILTITPREAGYPAGEYTLKEEVKIGSEPHGTDRETVVLKLNIQVSYDTETVTSN